MSDNNYVFGRSRERLIGDSPQYVYGLRRTDEGELYFVRVNQLSRTDSFSVNRTGEESQNFNDFEVGIDFYEGRDAEHNIVFENLVYEQYRWDERDLWYYVDDEGNLIVVVNQKHTYPTGISSNG